MISSIMVDNRSTLSTNKYRKKQGINYLYMHFARYVGPETAIIVFFPNKDVTNLYTHFYLSHR